MNKLLYDSKIYHDLLFIIWVLAGYYQKMFGYTVPDKASDISAELSEESGITKLCFTFPAVSDFDLDFPAYAIADIYNTHLMYDLLPTAGIPRYKAGDSLYETVESFIVDAIERTEDKYMIHMVYVDNPIAYEYVRRKPVI